MLIGRVINLVLTCAAVILAAAALLGLPRAAHADSQRACSGYATAWDSALRSGKTQEIAEARAEAQTLRALCPELLKRIDAYHRPAREKPQPNNTRPEPGSDVTSPPPIAKDAAHQIAAAIVKSGFARNPYLASDSVGVMLYGVDVVSAFDAGKAEVGNIEVAELYDGAIWFFSSVDHRNKFDSDHERYEPVYGGYCAYCMAAKDFGVRPTWNQFATYKNRIYYFANSGVRDNWLQNPEKYISDGNKFWDDSDKSKLKNIEDSGFSASIRSALSDIRSR